MGESVEECKDGMTELERKIVYERMGDIENEDKLGDISELIEHL